MIKRDAEKGLVPLGHLRVSDRKQDIEAEMGFLASLRPELGSDALRSSKGKSCRVVGACCPPQAPGCPTPGPGRDG